MLDVQNYDIITTKSDSISLTFEFFNADGTAYLLSDNEFVHFIIARSEMDANFNGNIIHKTLTNPNKNFITVVINPAETASISAGDYVYCLRIVNNDVVYTPYNPAKFVLKDVLSYEVNP